MPDLTWNEVKNACPTDAIFDDVSKGVCINISLLTGDAIADLANEGVIEAVYKLVDYCYAAQTTKNNGLPSGSKLTAFSAPTFSAPTAGTSPTTTARHSVNAQFPVNLSIASSPIG